MFPNYIEFVDVKFEAPKLGKGRPDRAVASAEERNEKIRRGFLLSIKDDCPFNHQIRQKRASFQSLASLPQ